ncbi:MAG: site-2 protease family protein [Archangium sp.]|nr:site-2 protease family protein [Archangium sp.]MDP3153508.1 site-2 protease family protein [Archangium sp.]MDP3574744.1 site-2 protease family protein [Archangium sp.]
MTARSPGFLLARLFGIEVRLDWSLAIIFALVTMNLGLGVLPSWHPEWGLPGVWFGAVFAASLLFASLLAHELSHALVARTQGVPVTRVTLFLFGGVAHLENEPPSARAEFLIAVVGPITSLVLGFLMTGAGLWLAGPELSSIRDATMEEARVTFSGMGAGVTLLLWLGPLNVMLALFNMVPGFPLDGGRVLRSVLWASTGDLLKATRWASNVGQVVAWSIMAIGVLNLLRGNIGGGVWLLLIGWFVNRAAKASFQQQALKHALEDVPVSRVMVTRLDRIAPTLTIDEFVRDHVMAEDQLVWPVEAEGVLLGMIAFDDLRKVPRESWSSTRVRDVMIPVSQLSTLPPGAGAEKALEELTKREVEQLPVLEGGHLLGLVRRQDLMRWLSLQMGPKPV